MSDTFPNDSRIDAIVDAAVDEYNAARVGTDGSIPEPRCLRLINECIREDLALEDYFTQESLVDITAAEDTIDLKVAIPGIRRVLGIELAGTGSIYADSDLQLLTHVLTWQQLQELRKRTATEYAALAYCLFGLKVWWLNTPSASSEDAINVLNSYYPAAVGTGSGEDFVDTPEEIPNRLFVAYILRAQFLKDNRRAGAPELYKVWNSEYIRQKNKLLDAELPTDIGLRPSRGL